MHWTHLRNISAMVPLIPTNACLRQKGPEANSSRQTRRGSNHDVLPPIPDDMDRPWLLENAGCMKRGLLRYYAIVFGVCDAR